MNAMPHRPDQTVFGHVQERFETRARALVYARLALMAIGLLVLGLPRLRNGLAITLPSGIYWYLGLLTSHVLSYLWVGRSYARTIIFSTLCVDLLALLYLIIASGGIHSPLMPAQLVFTMLFALLFPRPLAIIPPLLTLPVLATVAQILGTHRMPDDLLLVLWYSALNVTVVYVVVYLEGRERLAFAQVMELQRERRQAALDSQRTRIAREIHDGVGAALSGILLQAEYLGESVKDPEIVEEVREVREAAAEGMDELRRAVSILHREFALSSSVPDYLAAFGSRQRLEVSAEVSGTEPELAPEALLATFRILQEALANVARHAEANTVCVTLRFAEDEVVLTVADDGAGFVPDKVVRGHYGLRNMSERCAKVGGEVRIISTPGEGTTIEARVPASPGP
jgi:two-component system sensor histidine kinase DegS